MEFPEPNYKAIAEKMRGLALDEISSGDVVVLPSWYRPKNRQRRVNIVLQICDEDGREYIYMTAKLQNGQASQDRRSYVYWPLSKVSSLNSWGSR